MEDTKAWWQSNTIWASILQMATGLAISMGWINDIAGQTIVAEGPGLVVGAVTTLLAIWSFYGRVRATKQLSG